MISPRGFWGWMVIRRYDGSTSHQQCYQSSYHAGVCLRGTGNKRTWPLSPTDTEPSNGPSSGHLRFDSKPYPGSTFGLISVACFHRHTNRPSPTASPIPERMEELDPIRNAVPLPSAHALNAGPVLGEPARIKRAGTTTIPARGWQRGDEDDRWISVEEMPGAVTGSKGTAFHSGIMQ